MRLLLAIVALFCATQGAILPLNYNKCLQVNPCENGGRCHTNATTKEITCFCKEGFKGKNCEDNEGDMLHVMEENHNAEVVVVLATSPNNFRQRAITFLRTLSETLRYPVTIRSDSEGLMVFNWKNGTVGKRISVDTELPQSVTFVGKTTRAVKGVIVWLNIDLKDCRDCGRDILRVVDLLEGTEVQKKLEDLGMIIKDSRRDVKEPTENSSVGMVVIIVIIIVGVFILSAVGVVFERTRKRTLVTAPTWIPPTEAQNRTIYESLTEFSEKRSFFGNDYHYSNVKRFRAMPPTFHSDQLPLYLFQNQVFPKPPVKRVFPPFSYLHRAAESMDRIPFPIDPSLVNERHGPSGNTPLHLLVCNPNMAIEQILVEMENLHRAGANMDIQDEDERTALFIVSQLGKLKLAKKLLELGANPTKMDKQNSTPLHQAAHNGDVLLAKELLRHESVRKEINEVDKLGRTALMCSSYNDFLSTAVAAALIDAGADPSFQGDRSVRIYTGRSAMHFAAQHGNTKMLRFLLDKGADKNAQDVEGCTPLIVASRATCAPSVRILIEAGANQNISDQKDYTPRKVAKENCYREILEILDKAPKIYDEVASIAEKKVKTSSKTRTTKRKHG